MVFSTQECLLFAQELIHFTQKNFTFITQEITNTLLKKFEGP